MPSGSSRHVTRREFTSLSSSRTGATPRLQLLKRAVEKKRFGRIYMVTINVFWNRPQEYYDSAKWRGTWEFDGGAFMNQASHYVDLLDWLIGPVQSVPRVYRNLGAGHRSRGYRRREHPMAKRSTWLGERHHVDVPTEPGRFNHCDRGGKELPGWGELP